MKSPPVPPRLFEVNRSRLAGLMSPGAVVLIGSARRKRRNGDQYYPFRQRSDFFYLTGINLEESFFAFCPDHPDPSLREILFIRRSTPRSVLWDGPRPGLEQVAALSGIARTRWLEEKEELLQQMIGDETLVYCDQETVAGRYSHTTSLAPLMQELRTIKQPEEIDEIRRAVAITRSAFLKVLERTEPGLYEYQLEAEILGEFIGRGADGNAFETIVASGKNALILHYVENSSPCKAGELLLMDFGAEVNHYAADCSRTIPVNGRFTGRQRLIYEAVFRVFLKARDMMQPGTLMADFHQHVGELWEEEHIGLGLYSRRDVTAHSGPEPLWKKYFMHGTSHSMGLDVHDPFDRSKPFRPGMVLTCEPAIYIPEEGIGIRLENDILITEKGPLDLMEEIPMDPDEIEERMNRNR